MAPRTEATGVFLVRLRAVFRSGFRLAPINSWRSESSLSCMNVSSFQCARARRSTCCESGRLCAQAWQRRWENSRNFQQNLISSACFHARGRRSSRCRISDDLGIVGKLACYLLFQRYRPCTEASLGSQDMILRTEAVGMFLMPRGHLLTEIPA
uniref:Uncharacterized protein n=1 Tax=Fagus sylvatica TaxID=28930 RepID=A0A2N9IJH6_FAGSY